MRRLSCAGAVEVPKLCAIVLTRSLATGVDSIYNYISTSRTVRAPNRRLTRPRSHNPQAVTGECQPTRQAQWSHGCASDDKTRQCTYQRFVEALVLRLTLSCTRRRHNPHSSAAAGWTWLRAQGGCFDFSRACVPICEAMSPRES